MLLRVRVIGLVTTIAGSPDAGSADGQGTLASFSGVSDIAADSMGRMYVADYTDGLIRSISPEGV